MNATNIISKLLKNILAKGPLHLSLFILFMVLFVSSLFTEGITSILLSYINASLIFSYILFINRNKLCLIFKKFDRETYVYMVFIVFLALAIILFYSAKFAVVDDWENILCGKLFVIGEPEISYQTLSGVLTYFSAYNACNYGYTYPYFLSLIFLIFGATPASAEILSYVMYIVGGLSVFLSSMLLFNNKKASLFSSIAFILFYDIVMYTTVFRGRAQIMTCFVAFALLIFLLTFRTKSNSMIIASFIAIFFAAGIKYEILNLIYPLLIGIHLFMKYNKKRIIITVFSFTLCFFIFFSTFANIGQFFSIHGGEWSVIEMSRKDAFQYSDILDKAVNSLLGPNFSTTFLKKNILSFVQYWTAKENIIIVLLSIFGAIVAFRENRKKTIFSLACFFFLTAIYMLYYITYYSRFAMIGISFIVVFFGFGIFWFIDKAPKYKNHIFVALVFALIFSMIYSFNSDILNQRNSPYVTEQDYDMAINIKQYCDKNSTIVVPFQQTKSMLMFMLDDYKIFSLEDFFTIDDYIRFRSGTRDMDAYNITLPTNDKICLIYNYRCTEDPTNEFGHFSMLCNKILKEHKANYVFNSTNYKIVILS